MKGLVLAGGRGTRLRPITYSTAKQLVPVANTPILFFGLEDLAAAGVAEVGVVISPETGAEVQRAVGDGSAFGLDVTYIVQDRPLGLAHAVATALPFIDGSDVVVYLGDNLVTNGVADVLADFEAQRPACQILVAEVPNPSSFGVVELGESGEVVRLVEKPDVPPSSLALVGVYVFDGTIGRALEALEPSARGEYEITDAIQYQLDHGLEVRSSLVRGWWKDTGKKADLLHANHLVLEGIGRAVAGETVDTRLIGDVRIDAGAVLTDCVVRGPAVVGAGSRLVRVEVGPNSSIGTGCVLQDATVTDSILMDGVVVRGWRLRSSLLGRHARLVGGAPEGVVEVTMGEHSAVEAG